jgi:hypothetical protein
LGCPDALGTADVVKGVQEDLRNGAVLVDEGLADLDELGEYLEVAEHCLALDLAVQDDVDVAAAALVDIDL